MLFSEIDTTYLANAIKEMQGKKLILWGAGRRVKGFVEQYCGDGKLLPRPYGICDSTRDIAEETLWGIPVLPFQAVRNMLPKDTVIIITAGLLELQAKVVSSELYYFPLFHCRSFEVYDYLQKNMDACDRAIRALADPLSVPILKPIPTSSWTWFDVILLNVALTLPSIACRSPPTSHSPFEEPVMLLNATLPPSSG